MAFFDFFAILFSIYDMHYNAYCQVFFINRAGNPIEVFYNPIGEDTIKVFHAMGMRAGALEQLRD
jgi:hypothetical protein